MSQWDHPAILAEAQPFRGLRPEVLETVWRAGKVRAADRGDRLFTQGEPCSCFYVLLSGSVKMVQVTEDGGEVVLGFINPGEMFACLAVTGGETYPASAVVEAPSRAVAWDRDTIGRLMMKYPEIGQNALETFGSRLQNSRERMVDMATKTSEQRIASVLLRLARRRMDIPVDPETLRAPIEVSRQDVAAMSGTGLYTVSRTLQSWQRAGCVELGRRQVRVVDPAELQAIARGQRAPAA